MDDKAQLSAELIIIMGVIIAFAIILFNNLKSTTQDASEKLEKKTDDLLRAIDKIKAD